MDSSQLIHYTINVKWRGKSVNVGKHGVVGSNGYTGSYLDKLPHDGLQGGAEVNKYMH